MFACRIRRSLRLSPSRLAQLDFPWSARWPAARSGHYLRLEAALDAPEGPPLGMFALARQLLESQRAAIVAREEGFESARALIPAGWAALQPA